MSNVCLHGRSGDASARLHCVPCKAWFGNALFQCAWARDSRAQSAYQPVVIHSVEKFRQIDIHDKPVSFLDVASGLPDRHVLGSFRSKSKAELREGVIPNGLQYLSCGLLDQAVKTGRNAEQTNASVRFRYFLPAHRQGLVAPRQQVRLDLRPVSFEISGQFFHGHPVDARCAFVLADLAQGPLHVLPLTDGLHEPDSASRAFGQSLRNERFRTPVRGEILHRTQVQLKLVLLLRYVHQMLTPTCLSHLPSPFGVGTVRAFCLQRRGLAYLLLRLSALECLISLACLRPTVPSADCRGGNARPRLSRGASGNFRRVTVGATSRASYDQLGLPHVLPPRPECSPPQTRFLYVGPRLCLRLPPHDPLLDRSCLGFEPSRCAGFPFCEFCAFCGHSLSRVRSRERRRSPAVGRRVRAAVNGMVDTNQPPRGPYYRLEVEKP